MGKRNKFSSVLLAIFMTFSIFLGGCSENNTVSTNKNVEQKTEAQKLDDQNKKEEQTKKEEQKKKDEESKKIEEEKKNKLSEFNLVEAKVKRVVDGDTIELEDGKKVRLIGINTPESTTKHEPYGKEASNYTKSELEGKTVYLEKDVSETDRYGRLLRYVWINIPKDKSETEIRTNMFNALLALNGFAQQSTYPPDVKYQNYFGKYAAEARKNNKGLWAIDPNGTTKGDNNKVAKSNSNNSKNKSTANVSSNSSTKSKSNVVSKQKPRAQNTPQQKPQGQMVWLSATGSKYHSKPNCGKMNPKKARQVPLSDAQKSYSPCSKCF